MSNDTLPADERPKRREAKSLVHLSEEAYYEALLQDEEAQVEWLETRVAELEREKSKAMSLLGKAQSERLLLEQKLHQLSHEPKAELAERCIPFLDALVGYIDGFYGIAIHYKIPARTAADYCKHMHSAVIGLKRRLGLPFDPDAGKHPHHETRDRPPKCPTCLSDDPNHSSNPSTYGACLDSWHDRPAKNTGEQS